MKNIFLLLPLLSLLTSCLFSHGDLCTFYCEEADFTFSVRQRGDANVLIFSSYDSVLSRPSKSGSYYGIEFYYLKDDSTIFIKGESASLEMGIDSTLNLVIPSPYKIVSHTYKIKYLQQNVDWKDPNFLKYDDSILGNDYWWFKGNVCDWAGAYSFSYGHSSNKDAKLLEAQSPPLNFFIRAFPSHEHKEVTGEDSASPMVRR